jgi:hypothetical protein
MGERSWFGRIRVVFGGDEGRIRLRKIVAEGLVPLCYGYSERDECGFLESADGSDLGCSEYSFEELREVLLRYGFAECRTRRDDVYFRFSGGCVWDVSWSEGSVIVREM